jgi:hypothetical protein
MRRAGRRGRRRQASANIAIVWCERSPEPARGLVKDLRMKPVGRQAGIQLPGGLLPVPAAGHGNLLDAQAGGVVLAVRSEGRVRKDQGTMRCAVVAERRKRPGNRGQVVRPGVFGDEEAQAGEDRERRGHGGEHPPEQFSGGDAQGHRENRVGHWHDPWMSKVKVASRTGAPTAFSGRRRRISGARPGSDRRPGRDEPGGQSPVRLRVPGAEGRW